MRMIQPRSSSYRDIRTLAKGIDVFPRLGRQILTCRTFIVYEVVMDGYVRSVHHDKSEADACAEWWRELPNPLREDQADLTRCEVADEWRGLLPDWSRRPVSNPA